MPSRANLASPGPANRLVHEKSPYLQQHAHNPVDWYPWGEEAIERARREDKPLFLSIGYSTCHWCHVMERESFENEEIAAILNERFVCIKVDREERPDLDEIYMNAVQAMTGQGGWPLSAWLTPDLRPFYGGTYFPPEDRFGHPGFRNVLIQLSDAYAHRRDQVEAAAAQLGRALSSMSELAPAEAGPGPNLVDATFAQLQRIYDRQRGGWGGAPKFPRSDFGALCLRVFRRTGEREALAMATQTLDAMASGGIYDHLGGGFHRYSTDDEWLAPHFEKMLYDNAQLAYHYLEGFQVTGRREYANVVRETLEYVLRDLTHPEGGFYSAEDADSEGEEGRFYVWTREEIERLLPQPVFTVFAPAYDVTERGNFEGKVILRRVEPTPSLARRLELPPDEVARRLEEGRRLLLAARGERIRPGLDDKVLTGWNGLMITAFARAATVLEEPRYAAAAAAACEFVLTRLRTGEGLLRRWREGEARFSATAEDYAFLVRGLVETYQATFELRFARAARELHAEMFDRFGDPRDGALFNTQAGQDDLLVRVKLGYDGSVPTANSVALTNCILLYELTAEAEYAKQAERLASAFAGELRERPTALVSMTLGLDAMLADRAELVLAGDDLAGVRHMVHRARGGYHPDLVISFAPAGKDLATAAAVLPNLAGKTSDGAVTAYVCRAFACRLPTADEEEMLKQLDLLQADSIGLDPGALE